MRASEWLTIAYFAYLGFIALLRPAMVRRPRALLLAVGIIALIMLAPLLPAAPSRERLRDWLPAVYLLAGYWLSGLYFTAPMAHIEQRFLTFDRLLYRGGLTRLVAVTPWPILDLVEFAYLSCFIFVPGGSDRPDPAIVGIGHRRELDLAIEVPGSELGPVASNEMWAEIYDRLAALAAQHRSTLIFVNTRRLVVRRLNLYMCGRTSIGWNTFPSGHVAGALAAALAVSEAVPSAGVLMMLGAGLIAVSTVIGRYHYAVDGIAGALLTLIVWTFLHLL